MNDIAVKQLQNPIPGDALLQDYSLINVVVEESDLEKERVFFDSHPDLGELVHHPIYGALVSPEKYPAWYREKLAKIPSLGNLRGLISRAGQAFLLCTSLLTVFPHPTPANSCIDFFYTAYSAG